MNSRLKSPFMAAVISGALVAGGLFAAPAFAGTPVAVGPVLADEPTNDTSSAPAPDQSSSSESPAPQESTSSEPTPDASSSAPVPGESSSGPAPEQSSSAPADTTKPTGGFTINAPALWVGQGFTLTQVGVADDTSSASQIKRKVEWGDTTSSDLSADATPVTKQYLTAGTYEIKLTLTDAAGNTSSSSKTVVVTVPGKVTFSRTTVWPGQLFDVQVSNIPAGTTQIRIDEGDGYVGTIDSKYFKGQKFVLPSYYYHRHPADTLIRGLVPVKITYRNQYGDSAWILAGKINVLVDTWKPVVKITKPARANRIGSWKYIRGTVTEKGSGAPEAYVWVTRKVGKKVYCFTPQRQWKQVFTQAQAKKYCWGILVKVTKGKWSLRLTGLKTGTLYVDAKAWDWADNGSKWASVKVKITRR